MNAINRFGAGLLGLLLFSAAAHSQDRIWISPVFKTPLPSAPSASGPGFYYVDAYGRICGPSYYLRPAFPPFNGILPGATGQAIMSGNLPHELLLSKEGMKLGNVPLLGQKKKPQGGEEASGPPPGAGMPPMAGGPMPYPNPMGGMASRPQAPPGMQTPYAAMPMTPYAQQPAYYAPPMPWAPPVAYAPGSPYPMPGSPYPMPGSPYPMPWVAPPAPQARPVAYIPYYGPPGGYAITKQDPRTGIWLVQNVIPGQGATPFQPIPGFRPPVSGPPAMPMQPMGPMGPMGPIQPFQQFGPVQQFTPFTSVQGPQPPRMDWQPMQLPRMDRPPPPQQPQAGGNSFPTHPFTRSPRDFFMWGESMDDERARGSRPFPVP
ncbi:MAG: hypothetical protein HY289_00685 [Planctomycetes bacterium]|nr:hypothetical protein [Planctomycetota bacterium]